MNLSNPEECDLACAEYVIGLMTSTDREIFERHLATDAELVAGVARWRDQFSGLHAKVGPVEPSPGLWARIESALRESQLNESQVPTQSALPREAARSAPQARLSLWNSLALWRTISAVAVAVSVVLLTLVTTPQPDVRVYVAVLKSPEQVTGWLVQAREHGKVRLVPLNPQEQVPDDKTLQLWTQPAGMAAPIPIALVQVGTSFELSAEQLPELGESQLFAISLEPAGGSPTGLPTGPILFAGNTEPI